MVLVSVLIALFWGANLYGQGNDNRESNTVVQAVNQARYLDLPPGGSPMVVHPTFHLLAIHKIDDEAETFEFSCLLTLVWKDPRQAFDPALEGVAEKVFSGRFQFNEISPAWYPQVVLANAAGTDESQGVLLRVKPDGTSTLFQTIHSIARSDLDLRRYPFDHQRMEAVFGVLGFDGSEVILALDENGEATGGDLLGTRVPQWDLLGVDAAVRQVPAAHAGAGLGSSVFAVSLDLSRKSFFMVRLVILPLMIIVVLSWSVFWMDRSSLGDRMSVSLVGILTAVAYQLMVSEVMPHIAYVTLMNAFLSFSFLVMSATVAVNLAVANCDRRGDSKGGDRIDHRSRWIFPLVYAGLIVVGVAFMFYFF